MSNTRPDGLSKSTQTPGGETSSGTTGNAVINSAWVNWKY
jgi:hypothetical protein